MINVTDTAAEHLKSISEANEGKIPCLRLKGGGCAGFEYQWGTYATAEELADDDQIIYATKDATFIVGAASMMFLFGTTIDYKKDIMGSMFDISNPNAQSSCGCGVSVNFDMDKLSEPVI